mgnify:CR=1 FL=1
MSESSGIVLVTGASGFIGAHIVTELLKKGIKTRAMLRNMSLSSIFQENENLEVVYGDLFDVESLKKAIDGCESVIHCAANLLIGNLDPQTDVIDTSVIGVENLCSVMENIKTIIHTSSVAAIRPTYYKNRKIFTVNDWCDDASLESNPYGYAKAEAERKMRLWAKEKDVKLITIHPSIVFGPILHPKHMDGSMSYLKHFVKGPPFVLDININFVDVRDVALAHINALNIGENSRRYLTHTGNMWMKEIGQCLKKRKGGRWATRRLPKTLAYILAIFHPKLTIKQLKGSLGKKVSYDVEDTWDVLEIKPYNPEETIIDSIESILHQ